MPNTSVFVAGFGLGLVVGLALGAAVCGGGGDRAAMNAGNRTGIVAPAPARPPTETAPAPAPAPAEKPAQ